MRWDRLFAELEAEAGELAQRDRDAEIADRTRAELGRVRWIDRVRASAGATVRVRLPGADLVEGTVLQVGADWLLLRAGANDVLVPAWAVVGVEGAGSTAWPVTEGAVTGPTRAAAWRVLARDRARVRVVRVGGSTMQGVPVRVGADFVELDPRLGEERGEERGDERREETGAGLGGDTRSGGGAPVLVPYAAITAAYAPRDAADR